MAASFPWWIAKILGVGLLAYMGTLAFTISRFRTVNKMSAMWLPHEAADRKRRQQEAGMPVAGIQVQWAKDDGHFLSESFDRRTLFDMEMALDKACALAKPDLQDHYNRSYVAKRIIARVQAGPGTPDAMTQAALTAVEDLRRGSRS